MKEKECGKMRKILQICFNFNVPGQELGKTFLELAPAIADVEGLLWKVWCVNEAEKSFCGVYLFEDEAKVKAYLDGEIIAAVKKHPALIDININVFDIMLEHTKITRGPVD